MAVRVILSDLHFGDRKCSLRREAVSKGFRKFLLGLGRIKEVILAGDILDANIASLTQAIEGVRGSGTWPRRIGFRKWLSFTFGGRGVPVGRIVYVPGNHDISNQVMAADWDRRFGSSYYHFVYRDVLFLCLNTEDQKPSNISEKQIEYVTDVWNPVSGCTPVDGLVSHIHKSYIAATRGILRFNLVNYLLDALNVLFTHNFYQRKSK